METFEREGTRALSPAWAAAATPRLFGARIRPLLAVYRGDVHRSCYQLDHIRHILEDD